LHRQSVYLVILSLLLVGLGFFLGQYYALAKGMLWQATKIVWSANDSPSPGSVEKGDKLFLHISGNTTQLQELEEHSTQEATELQFPSKVDNLYIEKIISGKEALEHSQNIFGTEAPVKRLFIPYYSSSENQVVVWVFEMNSSLEARQYTEKINLYINESETCSNSGSFFLQNVEVNYVEGLNYDNYYYCKNNIIYWITLAAKDPMPLFLRFYELF